MSDTIEIDGGRESGSGTILRYGLLIAALSNRPLHIKDIRAKRQKPGLKPQHLTTVEAFRDLTAGAQTGAQLNSQEISFTPSGEIRGGRFSWDIGTAGSTTMMALALLPALCFAKQDSIYKITGGLFQDFAPNPYHTQNVLFPLLGRMGVEARLAISKPGYVPRGNGAIEVRVVPLKSKLKPIRLLDQGRITQIKGVAISSHLKERRVSDRISEACQKALCNIGYEAEIEVLYDEKADQQGAAGFICATTDTGCILGADMAGKLGRTSEEIGKRIAYMLFQDFKTQATVDRFVADQLIIYAALAEGTSEYIVPEITAHVKSNLWLISEFLGAKYSLEDRRIIIEGIGLTRNE